ncbi:hypothetical protein [Streptomyces sp. MBT62]|uniref:hypothetical protein n=1 Tax=Streptomyces sp. MBT62 TaxID=2800410 RepID=UPI001F3614B5|nr:hypothetical protein [Streptomyces sp. MBT62]
MTDSQVRAVVQRIPYNSGQCLDDTNLSTANGTQNQQYYCEGGYRQMLDLNPVTALGTKKNQIRRLLGKS